jgi:D-glycero-alpha-D-manno-heptose 1-phosphate guanylyltransferase
MGGGDWSGKSKAGIRDVTAFILAGGLGTRLRSVLPDTPKAMAPIAGAPFLNHLLDKVALSGVTRTVLCTGHLAGQIEVAIGGSYRGMEMAYSREDRPMGTGGAVRLALPLLDTSRVLVLNGDSFCDFDSAAHLDRHESANAQGTLVLARVDDCSRYGSVTLGADDAVSLFQEKGAQKGAGWINAGVYLLERRVLEGIPEGREVSLERETFPRLVGNGLYGFRMASGGFIDIGTPDSYAQAQAFFQTRGGAFQQGSRT